MSVLPHAVLVFLLGTALATHGATLDLDPSYGTRGQVTFETGLLSSPDGNRAFGIVSRAIHAGSGKVIVSGTHPVQAYADGSRRVMFARRLNADGSPDTAFGIEGEVRFTVRGGDSVNGIAMAPGGKILVAVAAADPCVRHWFGHCANEAGTEVVQTSAVVRLMPDGTPDRSFGGTGIVEVAEFYGGYAVAVQPDGRILLLGTTSFPRLRYFNWKLARLNEDGTRDPTFNAGQPVTSRCDAYGYALLVQPDGGIVVGGDSDIFLGNLGDNPGVCVERLHGDGSPDTSFNRGESRTRFGIDVTLRGLTWLPDGKILMFGKGGDVVRTGPETVIYPKGVVAARFNADGTLDSGYGAGGWWFVPIGDAYGYVDFAFTGDSGFVAAGVEYSTSSGTSKYGAAFLKVNSAGAVDTSFGSQGIARTPTGNSLLTAFVRDNASRWLLVGNSILGGAGTGTATIERRLGDNPPLATVVEFHNADLQHYFVTASADEAAAIDAGAAGPGWRRTGFTFRAGGVSFSRVCRFYGNTNLDPATGRMYGPNSHFYTVDPVECGNVARQYVPTARSWKLEDWGAFSVTLVFTDDACPAATVPIYRAYNNGFARGIDSNHRLTGSLDEYRKTVAAGWIGEGVVMCAPTD